MLWAFALAAAANTAPDVALLGISVSSETTGLCSGDTLATPAAVEVAWTVANTDDALHRIEVYEDGVLQTTLLPSVGRWVRTVPGYVQDGAFNTFVSAWVFAVKLVRLSDSAVLDTATASAWAQTYGTCAATDA